MIGKTIDKYVISEEIGQGGMAVVYRAQDTKLKRDVAIKILHPHLARQKEAVERFQREAVTVAKLQHPNIIDIYDYSGEESVDRYIVTELIDGLTLADFIEKYDRLPSEMVACIAREICLALKHAHEQGVIHRDLKPENVMIRKDGKIKLMDFGIARIMEGANLTITGAILGSPAFMSPEQVTGQQIDCSSDLFSLGSIIYLMSTGVMAFKGHNPHEILKKVVEGDYTPAQHIAPSMSDNFSAIIDKLLCIKRESRYQSAAELLNDLDLVIKDAKIEQPTREVNLLFADPESYIEKFNKQLVEILLRKARDIKEKIPPLAMQYYNRILAIDPENSEANKELTSILNRRNLVDRIKKIAFAGVALLAVATVFWMIIYNWQPKPEKPEKKELVDEVLASFPAETKTQQPESEKAIKTLKQKTAEKKAEPNSKAKLAKPVLGSANGNRIIKKELKPEKVEKSITGRMQVYSAPWADIYVNGKKVGNYPMDADKVFDLQEGKNIVKLVNPSCETFEKIVNIEKADQVVNIRQRLKIRPSFLRLDNSQGAMLFVDGKFRGRTPLDNELEIRWDQHVSQKTMLVSLTKEGYEPFNGKVRFSAGKTVPLKVLLKKKN